MDSALELADTTAHLQQSLDEIHQKFRDMMEKITMSELLGSLSNIEKCKLEVLLAYSINTLFYSTLACCFNCSKFEAQW